MKQFNQKIQEQFAVMAATGKLFRLNITGQQVWDLYLRSFTKENDPVFRDPESSTHNCNHCKNFIRRYGNIVSIGENFELISIFNVSDAGEYQDFVTAFNDILKTATITEVFFETFNELNSLPYEVCKKTNEVFRLGIDSNTKRYTKEEAEKYGVVKADEIRKFNHMHLDIPVMYVDMSGRSVEALMGNYRDAKNVFQRAMETIPLDTLTLVRDLINQGSLLDGATHLFKIDEIIPLKTIFDSLDAPQRDAWCWSVSYKLPYAKFRNELIGVLCSELAEGMDLNLACTNWNKRVDPANYMKATAPITKAQIELARKFIEENDYVEAFNRRFANIDDIVVSEILHSNVGNGKIKTVSMFDNVKPAVTKHKDNKFEGIEEVSIETFMKDILPGCTSVEVLLKNDHEGHMVSLTTANVANSRSVFKWNNNYSWTFNGNLAGRSQLADMVTAKGGRIDGAFRFTHSWNELEPNQSLMDLHVFMPGCTVPTSGGGPNVTGRRVGWNNRTDNMSGGTQDVDYVSQAPKGYIPVENITFPTISKMPEGIYVCKIHNYSFRHSGGRGKAEIAFGGNSYQYEYPATKHHSWITVAEVTLKNGVFTIDHKLKPTDGNEVSKEIYGLETNNFYKVNLLCLSPNHWNGNNVGNKHYFFMLEGCKAPAPIRSFHNENLIPEIAAHRKVMEVLGATNTIESVEPQLSGLGFNATVRDELIVRLEGSFKRVVKIKF
jgi:hypothetical protein